MTMNGASSNPLELGNGMQNNQPQAMKDRAARILERHENRRARRKVWETHWQDCLDHIVPRKNDMTTIHTPGSKRGAELFDTTAIMANNLLAGALHSMLTNPSTRFFDLISGDPKLDSDTGIKNYYQDCADLMFIALNNSNFQTEIHEIYIDLGAIGTAALAMMEHPEKIIHFSARPMREIFIDENNLGFIDALSREFLWNLRQVQQEFKDLPQELIDQAKKGDDKKWEIVHAIEPADPEDPKAKAGQFAFSSVYILKSNGMILAEKNFNEFPFAVPRWTKTTGEEYGRGPGMDTLPDVRMVNKMMETVLKGAQKTVDPPLLVPDDGVIGKIRLTPGGITLQRAGSDPIKPLITDARIDFGQQMVEAIRQRIREGFYVDQLQLKDGPQMTATEVNQRTEEKLRLMGPVLGRQHSELLAPLINRLYGIMQRRKLLPEPPAALKGKKPQAVYSSLVARAQRMSEGQNLNKAITVSAPLVNADPKTLDVLDLDAAMKYIMGIYGVPHKLIRTDQALKKIRTDKAQAAQQAAQEQSAKNQADVAGKVLPGVAQMMQAQRPQGS